MPRKANITKDMVIDAAFAVARAVGVENINARTVAKQLGCSTQPVMYHFATIEELKRAAYDKANAYHTAYLLHIPETQENALLAIGINYIRFAVEEPQLFRLIFQSGYVPENSLAEMIDAAALSPLLPAMQQAMQLPMEQVKEVFLTLALFVHGYASLLANNALEYNEAFVTAQLDHVYAGALCALKEEEKT